MRVSYDQSIGANDRDPGFRVFTEGDDVLLNGGGFRTAIQLVSEASSNKPGFGFEAGFGITDVRLAQRAVELDAHA